MNSLPQCLEDIIIDYKNQLEQYDELMKNIRDCNIRYIESSNGNFCYTRTYGSDGNEFNAVDSNNGFVGFSTMFEIDNRQNHRYWGDFINISNGLEDPINNGDFWDLFDDDSDDDVWN